MESKKVIHIHLKNQKYNNKTDFYFGSVAAAYNLLGESAIGAKQNAVLTIIRTNGKFENSRCRIIRGEIERKKQNKLQCSDK